MNKLFIHVGQQLFTLACTRISEETYNKYNFLLPTCRGSDSLPGVNTGIWILISSQVTCCKWLADGFWKILVYTNDPLASKSLVNGADLICCHWIQIPLTKLQAKFKEVSMSLGMVTCHMKSVMALRWSTVGAGEIFLKPTSFLNHYIKKLWIHNKCLNKC
jgi:hypothetical protein